MGNDDYITYLAAIDQRPALDRSISREKLDFPWSLVMMKKNAASIDTTGFAKSHHVAGV